MSLRIRVEIDDAQLDAVLGKLQTATGTGGATMGGIGAPSGGRPARAGGGNSVSRSPPHEFSMREMLFSPPKGGGSLPSIGRGTRTVAGMLGGQTGYTAVETYQKGLWLEQGLTGLTPEMMAAGIFTFAALMILEVKSIYEETNRRWIEQRRLLMEVSDIQNTKTWQAWRRIQEEPYWGRKD